MGTTTGRPAFPRSVIPNSCPTCGDTLEIKRGVSGEVRAVTHLTTGTLRCPPTTRTCSVCDRDGLVACSEPGCRIVGHPVSPCMSQCSCCQSWGCPAHVSTVDFLCTSCAAAGPRDPDVDPWGFAPGEGPGSA